MAGGSLPAITISIHDFSQMIGRFPLAVLALVIPCATPAWGQPKTDVVTLGNGDRITGEIIELLAGRLEFKTDDVGTIEIEWVKIVRIEADTPVRGRPRRMGAACSAAWGDRRLPVPPRLRRRRRVAVDAGGHRHRADRRELLGKARRLGRCGVQLHALERHRADDAELDTDVSPAGLSVRITSSATLTQRSDDERRDDRAALDVSYVRYRWRRWFVSGAGRLERTRAWGWRCGRRSAASSACAPSTRTARSSGYGGGLVANNEHGIDTEPTQNLEGPSYFKRRTTTYDRPKTNFDTSFQYYPSLSDWGRQRLQIDVGVKTRDVEGLLRRTQHVRHLRQRPAESRRGPQ